MRGLVWFCGGALGLALMVVAAAGCKPRPKLNQSPAPGQASSARATAASVFPPPAPPPPGCSAARAEKLGDWEPSAQDTIKAAALATLYCVEPPIEALTRCSESLSTGLVRMVAELPVTDCSPRAQPCALSIRSVAYQGRHWIVFHSAGRGIFFDQAGCGTFDVAQVSVVELSHPKPLLYLELSYRPGYGEHLDCATDMPKDWSTLPVEVRAHLCSER